MLGFVVKLRLAKFIRRRQKPLPEKLDILLTGTFFSDNWIKAHLTPIAKSARSGRVRFVSVRPLPEIAGVTAVRVPKWLTRMAGEVPSRLLTFIAIAIWSRPDVIGGFHLLLNAATSVVLARMLGRHSLYLCVGRARSELLMEGKTENRIFIHLRDRDPLIQRWLLEIAGSADLIVPMGSSSRRAFRELGVAKPIEVISGSVDETRYRPATEAKDFDLVFVGRVVPVKRVDLLLEAVAIAKKQIPSLRVLIVGDGPLLGEMKGLAKKLGIERDVEFAGSQTDSAPWLRRGKVFMLTSDSEGLSLALMEAMMCALPAIVSDVGDLGDLVVPGVTGYLVKERSAQAFAQPMVELLADSVRLDETAMAAYGAARKYSVEDVAKQWDYAFSELH